MEKHYNLTTYGYDYDDDYLTTVITHQLVLYYILIILFWAVFFVALPGICFAMYRLCSQIRSHDVVPVYVINVLISDLIQISTNVIQRTMFSIPYFDITQHSDDLEFYVQLGMKLSYDFAVLGNVYFMMCISVERYIMIAHPLWYRTVREIRTKVCVSVAVWILSAAVTVSAFFNMYAWQSWHVLLGVPYLPMLFLFVGTWRALSQSQLPRHGQRRILGIQALILFIYTICFLPAIIRFVIWTRPETNWGHYEDLEYSYNFLVALNPLFDLLLYVLVRAEGGIFSAFCCCFCKRQGGSTATADTSSTATHVGPSEV